MDYELQFFHAIMIPEEYLKIIDPFLLMVSLTGHHRLSLAHL